MKIYNSLRDFWGLYFRVKGCIRHETSTNKMLPFALVREYFNIGQVLYSDISFKYKESLKPTPRPPEPKIRDI
ncbi:hypothetical protein HNR33_004335 [Brassicibacter mesophilus]